MKPIRYYVSYSHKTGFGGCILTITKVFDIDEVKKMLQEKYNVKDIIILFFKKLEKYELWSEGK